MHRKLKVLNCSLVALTLAVGTSGSLYAQNDEFVVTSIAQFDAPWALEFLPDGRLLISEGPGAIRILNADQSIGEVSGVPTVSALNQVGLGDVVLHPDFEDNNLVYLSYVEDGEGELSGAVVARGQLMLDGDGGALSELEVIWRQVPQNDRSGPLQSKNCFRA